MIALIRQLFDLSSDSQFVATEQNALLRFQFFILVSFNAFLRYSHFVLLRLVVCIAHHSKCDQYQQGNTVTIAEQSGVAIVTVQSTQHVAILIFYVVRQLWKILSFFSRY